MAWHVYNDDLYAAYLVCQERGHQRSGLVTASVPPMDACKHCGSYYWVESVEHEMRTPLPAAQRPDAA